MSDCNGKQPRVAVCVAMRNEESNIGQCLGSLLRLKFPNYHVFLIDDHSSDDSFSLAKRMVTDNDGQLTLMSASIKTNGKAACLTELINTIDGYDYLAFTDADCVVSSSWLDSFFNEKGDYYLIAGTSGIIGKGLLTSYQRREYDELFYLVRLIGQSSPLPSMMGNNFIIKRAVFDELYGFADIQDSPVEDVSLLRKVQKKGYASTMLSQLEVRAKALTSFWDLIDQRKRWAEGAKSVILKTKMFIALFFFLKVMVYISPVLLGPVGYVLVLMRVVQNTLRCGSVFMGIIYDVFQLILYFFVMCISLRKTITWKGRRWDSC